MDDQDIKYLTRLLKRSSLFWAPDEKICREVVSVSTRFDEPGFCAFFSDGAYVTLWGCEITEFIVGTRLTTTS